MTRARSRLPAHNCSSPRVCLCPRRRACRSRLVCVDCFRWAELYVELVGAVFRVCVILVFAGIPDPRSLPVVASSIPVLSDVLLPHPAWSCCSWPSVVVCPPSLFVQYQVLETARCPLLFEISMFIICDTTLLRPTHDFRLRVHDLSDSLNLNPRLRVFSPILTAVSDSDFTHTVWTLSSNFNHHCHHPLTATATNLPNTRRFRSIVKRHNLSMKYVGVVRNTIRMSRDPRPDANPWRNQRTKSYCSLRL